jgi:Fic family protein
MGYNYTITPEMALRLQTIERVKTTIGSRAISATVKGNLQIRARLLSVHYSTQIEGNRLELEEVRNVVLGGEDVVGKEKDKGEVLRYFQALEKTETWVGERKPFSEERIRELHAALFTGKRSKPSVYRDGQNVIRNSANGEIVYLPPEAKDVPDLMGELISWISAEEKTAPVPIVAGMAHYQIVTIHPWYDGNGRTARALANWILYRNEYDLSRMVSLEEEYANDLEGYYSALQTSQHHNYYDGRAAADITPWLSYFLSMMEKVFVRLEGEILKQPLINTPEARKFISGLDRRAKLVIGLLAEKPTIKNNEVANLLDLSERQTRDIIAKWVEDGWLVTANFSRKAREYKLAEKYRRIIGGLSADSRKADMQ